MSLRRSVGACGTKEEDEIFFLPFTLLCYYLKPYFSAKSAGTASTRLNCYFKLSPSLFTLYMCILRG